MPATFRLCCTIQLTIRLTVNDLDASPKGKGELLDVAPLLYIPIKTKSNEEIQTMLVVSACAQIAMNYIILL